MQQCCLCQLQSHCAHMSTRNVDSSITAQVEGFSRVLCSGTLTSSTLVGEIFFACKARSFVRDMCGRIMMSLILFLWQGRGACPFRRSRARKFSSFDWKWSLHAAPSPSSLAQLFALCLPMNHTDHAAHGQFYLSRLDLLSRLQGVCSVSFLPSISLVSLTCECCGLRSLLLSKRSRNAVYSGCLASLLSCFANGMTLAWFSLASQSMAQGLKNTTTSAIRSPRLGSKQSKSQRVRPWTCVYTAQ